MKDIPGMGRYLWHSETSTYHIQNIAAWAGFDRIKDMLEVSEQPRTISQDHRKSALNWLRVRRGPLRCFPSMGRGRNQKLRF
jgi:hypothetical protein